MCNFSFNHVQLKSVVFFSTLPERSVKFEMFKYACLKNLKVQFEIPESRDDMNAVPDPLARQKLC
jgi:hypothetical protein